MRSLILISAVVFAAADNEGVQTELTANCMVDGAESVSDAMDSALFLWASILRCSKDEVNVVKCEVSVASAVKSLDSMITLILKAVDKCGALNTVNAGCGLAVGQMTKHMAGIAAQSGAIVVKCTMGTAPGGLNFAAHNEAMCLVNLKNSVKSLFKVVKAFMVLTKQAPCKAGDTKACASNAFAIIGAFASVGDYVAGTLANCVPAEEHLVGTVCASKSAGLVAQLSDFSAAAVTVSKACAPQPPAPYATTLPPGVRPEVRLYSDEEINAAPAASSSTNLLLAAFLPITAIVGFVGGRMYGSGRAVRAPYAQFAQTNGVE